MQQAIARQQTGRACGGLVVTGSWLDLNDDGDNCPDLQADLTRIPRRPPCTGGGNADAQYQAPLTVPCHDTEPIASRTWISVKGGWHNSDSAKRHARASGWSIPARFDVPARARNSAFLERHHRQVAYPKQAFDRMLGRRTNVLARQDRSAARRCSCLPPNFGRLLPRRPPAGRRLRPLKHHLLDQPPQSSI
jgi:hypothetical protein